MASHKKLIYTSKNPADAEITALTISGIEKFVSLMFEYKKQKKPKNIHKILDYIFKKNVNQRRRETYKFNKKCKSKKFCTMSMSSCWTNKKGLVCCNIIQNSWLIYLKATLRFILDSN